MNVAPISNNNVRNYPTQQKKIDKTAFGDLLSNVPTNMNIVKPILQGLNFNPDNVKIISTWELNDGRLQTRFQDFLNEYAIRYTREGVYNERDIIAHTLSADNIPFFKN